MIKHKPCRPFLQLAGSKWRRISRLERLFPEHVRYVSLFGGAASDLLAKRPSQEEFFNDIDPWLANIVAVIKNQSQELIARIKETRLLSNGVMDPDLLAMIRDILGQKEIHNPVEHALALLIVQWNSSPNIRFGSHSYLNWSLSKAEYRWENLPGRIAEASRRFSNVGILNQDWRDILDGYDSPQTLFFVDPPYYPAWGRPDLYRFNLTKVQHADLLDRLKLLRGSWLICGYDCELYADKLAPYKKFLRKYRPRNAASIKARHRDEYFWLSEML